MECPIESDTTKPTRAWVVGLFALLAAPSLHAEPSATDRAVAQQLFDEARALVGRSDFAAACPKFAESQRLDPGGGTLLNLASCHEQEGKTATAWVEFNDALTEAKKDGRAEREQTAATHIAGLTPVLSRLTIKVAEGVEPTSVVVTLDGVAVGPALFGTAAPVDPGNHEVSASAPGKKTWSQKIEIRSGGDNQVLEVPALAGGGSSAPAPLSTGPAPATKPDAMADHAGSSGRTVGFVVGGVGVVALGVGGFFGIRALSKKSDSDAHCTGTVCTQEGLDLYDQGKKAANIANIGIGVGLLGIGVGTYLVLSSSSAPPGASAVSARTRTTPASVRVGVRTLPRALGGVATMEAVW